MYLQSFPNLQHLSNSRRNVEPVLQHEVFIRSVSTGTFSTSIVTEQAVLCHQGLVEKNNSD